MSFDKYKKQHRLTGLTFATVAKLGHVYEHNDTNDAVIAFEIVDVQRVTRNSLNVVDSYYTNIVLENRNGDYFKVTVEDFGLDRGIRKVVPTVNTMLYFRISEHRSDSMLMLFKPMIFPKNVFNKLFRVYGSEKPKTNSDRSSFANIVRG